MPCYKLHVLTIIKTSFHIRFYVFVVNYQFVNPQHSYANINLKKNFERILKQFKGKKLY